MTTTTLDLACTCGCAKACHRRAMQWGQTVYTSCRHHPGCEQFTSAGTAAPMPEALAAYDAYACLACGSRYHQPYTDHPCGPLVPVIVTITRRQESTHA